MGRVGVCREGAEPAASRLLHFVYCKLAERTAGVMEARFWGQRGVSAESRLLQGQVWHNLHRFRAAGVLTRQLTARARGAADFGLLSGTLTEQDKLTEAVEVLHRMMNLRPDAEVHSRAAHRRG